MTWKSFCSMCRGLSVHSWHHPLGMVNTKVNLQPCPKVKICYCPWDDSLTCFTPSPWKACVAGTSEIIDQVCARASILTRIRWAVIYICKTDCFAHVNSDKRIFHRLINNRHAPFSHICPSYPGWHEQVKDVPETDPLPPCKQGFRLPGSSWSVN